MVTAEPAVCIDRRQKLASEPPSSSLCPRGILDWLIKWSMTGNGRRPCAGLPNYIAPEVLSKKGAQFRGGRMVHWVHHVSWELSQETHQSQQGAFWTSHLAGLYPADAPAFGKAAPEDRWSLKEPSLLNWYIL